MSKNPTLALLAGLIAGVSMLTAAETPPGLTPSNSATDPPKITHDWPGYNGPDGTYADQSKAPLLDDLSKARLVWVSEHADMGYGKTTSGGGHRYGPSHPSGSCDLIVAGGLVIAGYFNPKNNVVADDVLLALDAATGKTKWKQVDAGKGFNRSARKHVQYGPAPAAADGKVFHLSSGGRIYCVELATGKLLWVSDLGDYPEYYKTAAAKVPVNDDVKDGVSGALRRPLYTPLTVIGGVLMVTADRLYAYDTVTGKELWKLAGVSMTPCPAKIHGVMYALCNSGGDRTMRLVEPKTGKVLWTEKFGFGAESSVPAYIVADGRAFVPYSKEKEKARLAAFALSETGAKLLWQSKEEGFGDYWAYRDGVIYANIVSVMTTVRIMAFKGEDGTVLSDFNATNTSSLWGQFHLGGDRLVLIGDHCHVSLGMPCTFQSLTPGVKDLQISGRPFSPATFGKYTGVVGYAECWTRPASADGFLFTRSVNKETGQGAILCWDLRAQSESKK